MEPDLGKQPHISHKFHNLCMASKLSSNRQKPTPVQPLVLLPLPHQLYNPDSTTKCNNGRMIKEYLIW
jgi:hypothetical protein